MRILLAIAVSQNSPRATQTLLDNGAKLDLKIRPNLTIREFMERNRDDMSPVMQSIVDKALAVPQKIESAVSPIPVCNFDRARV